MSISKTDSKTAPNASGNPSSNDRHEELKADTARPDRMDRSLVRSGSIVVSPAIPKPKE